ncbi:MAG TPA: PASTA domain-containing protein [Thermodesulfovibrionia bacterium]|nr:PASTA domain-containing protein [Thermodesulfovibrionia bacterium]
MKQFLKFIFYGLVLMVLCGATILATLGILTHSKGVEVPSVTGKGIVDATNILEENGLKLKVDAEEYSMNIPKGSIARQVISAGTIVKEGRTIQVYISKGPRIPMVRSVEGKKIENAEQELLQEGVTIGTKLRIYSDIVEKDRVIAQNPMPGEPAVDTVDVIISLGPHKKIYRCPSFTDMTFQDAQALTKALGIRLNTIGEGDKITGQHPEKGSLIAKGDTVEIVLKEDTTVPPLNNFGN